MGIDLDIGEFPNGDTVAMPGDDPTALVRTVSHAVARIADRIPPLRKLSRHAEGSESRAGLVADIVSAVGILYARNTTAVETLLSSFQDDFKNRRAQRATPQPPNPMEGSS